MKPNEILSILENCFPNAECELLHKNPFELAVAVALSAQTTDVAVNKCTPALFAQFPTPELMAKATTQDIEKYIRKIGLYHNKAKNMKGLAQMIVSDFKGVMPQTMEELIKLPGIGRKSANVILSVSFGIPAIAVDTHVERISKRLKFAKKNDSILMVEKKLMKKIDCSLWNRAHHLFIFFGRYLCTARNPKCDECPLTVQCIDKKSKAMKGIE